MSPIEKALARREMDTYLRDQGVKHRPVALLDALLALFRSLGDPR